MQAGEMIGSFSPAPGLCGSCAHARVITNRRGSRFFLCRLSESDPAFPRYPPLPVLQCRGYQPAEPGENRGESDGPAPQ